MKKADWFSLLGLAALGVFIWCRDLRWLAAADDVLPILAGLPLFIWLRWPIRLAAVPGSQNGRTPFVAALFFASGVLLGSGLVLTVSWLLFFWAWFAARVVDGTDSTTRRLLVLPFFSFPWVATDFEQLGWWFRLSGATAAEHLLAATGANVSRDGTFLSVQGFQLSVEPACSGLNGLQSMLIAGTMLAFVTLRHRRVYWPALLFLPVAAWTANLMRILSGAGVALAMEPAAAARWVGPLHSIAGGVALAAMFAVCWLFFSQLARIKPGFGRDLWRRLQYAPVLELVILCYATWACRELLSTWFTNPFDRLGWLAFAIWLLPLGLANPRGLLPAGTGKRRPWYLGCGLALIFLGSVGELNAAQYIGLAFTLVGFAPRRRRAIWGVTAVGWMPVLGWVASRFSFDPNLTALIRIGVAVAGCGWVLWARKSPTPQPALDYAGRIRTTS